FDGDDMVAILAIDLVYDGRKRRGLAGSRWPRKQHYAVLQVRDVADLRRQVEAFDGRNISRNHAHNDRNRAALLEDVHPKTHPARQRIADISRPGLNKAASGIGVTLH